MNRLVITGGDGGLGQAIAGAFSASAWDVQAPGHGELDVTDENSVAGYFHDRQVDLLVCAAGLIRDEPLARMREEAWDLVFATNFRGASRCAAAVLPEMIARRTGHIIFISSRSALHPPLGQAAYATAKAALLGLTADLARRHGTSGIRVNAILPGYLNTPMTTHVSPVRKAAILTNHALGRLNTVEAVGTFIRCLHEDLPHTSGQQFQLDSRVE